MLQPHWDCATCTQKRERGCNDTPIIPFEIDGEELPRCPRRPLLDWPYFFKGFFEIYSWYQNGWLPDAGTYLDQAAGFTQVVRIIDKAFAEARKIKEDREQARLAAAQRR